MNTSLMMMPESITPEQSNITLEHITLEHSNLAQGNLAQGNLAQGNLAQGNLAQGNLAQGNLAQGSSELVAHKDFSLKTRRSEWKQVPLEQLRSGSDQPRRTYDSAALAELTQSVQDHGILQPILVRPITIKTAQHGPDCDKSACYEIVAGERRWWASQEAGLMQVPILVRSLSDAAAAEVSLVENLQREDLTPLEIAQALVRMKGQGYSVRKLASRIGKQKGWVEQHLFLARLPEDLQMMVSGRPDTLTHAREIEKVTDPVLRADLIMLVLDQDNPLALAKLRQLIKAASTDPEDADPKDANPKDANDEGHDVPREEPALQYPALFREADTESEADTSADMEPEADTSPDIVLHQEGLLANLRTAQKRLPSLPAPTDPARRQEIVAMLTATRDAIALTLARWGVQA